MAFRKKAAYILREKPDILIVPECEHPDKLKFPETIQKPTDIRWFGANPHKGIGIFSYSNYRLTLLKKYNPDFQYVIPISVTGGEYSFTLFAIWANNPADPDGTYVEQVWKALAYYKRELGKSPVILMGDFNSNTIWDRPQRKGNHSSVVELLKTNHIFSTYHHHFKQIQGKEKHPTLYMYRHKNKPYHLDYCFASSKFLEKLDTVKIGTHAKWSPLSDHVPIIVNFQ